MGPTYFPLLPHIQVNHVIHPHPQDLRVVLYQNIRQQDQDRPERRKDRAERIALFNHIVQFFCLFIVF